MDNLLPASYDNWRMSGPDEYYHWDEDDEAEAEEDDRMTANEVRWEIWDLMDEEVVEIWRAQVADGDTCPICNGERIIEEPHWNAQDELVQCPLCGPVFASKGPDAPEPAPF